jgi:hypothetical protein
VQDTMRTAHPAVPSVLVVPAPQPPSGILAEQESLPTPLWRQGVAAGHGQVDIAVATTACGVVRGIGQLFENRKDGFDLNACRRRM